MNYIKLERFSLRNRYYAYLDTPDYFSDQLFIRHQVRVYFDRRELRHPSGEYILVFCHVRKREERSFLDALAELPNKMMLMGRTDYLRVCDEIMGLIQGEEKEPVMRQGRGL